MHYSRLILNTRSSRVRGDLANAFEMHRSVMSAFPALTERERLDPDSGSILWRVDHDRRRGVVLLIVQSELAPNWDTLLEKYPGYITSPVDLDLPAVATMERHLSFQVDQRLGFRLRANPTVKKKVDGRKNGRRVGLTEPHEQLAWLQRKATSGPRSSGFRVLSAEVFPEDQRTQRKADATELEVRRELTHVAARFEGELIVTDPESFQQTLRSGIGSAKGFGFGLLSVARVS